MTRLWGAGGREEAGHPVSPWLGVAELHLPQGAVPPTRPRLVSRARVLSWVLISQCRPWILHKAS